MKRIARWLQRFVHQSDVLPFYWRLVIRPHLREATAIAFLMLGTSVMDMATVGLAVPLLDVVTNPEHLSQNHLLVLLTTGLERLHVPAGSNHVIFALLVLVCLLFIARNALLSFHQYVTAAIAMRFKRQTKAALFARFLHGAYESVSQRARGTVVYDIGEPSSALYQAMMNVAMLVSGVFDGLVMLGLMFYLSWWTTVIVGVVAGVGVQGWRRLSEHRSAAYGQTLYEVRGEQVKHEVDAIDGLKVVKAHSLEQTVVDRETALLDQEARPTLRLALFSFAPNLVNEVIASTIVLSLGAMAFLMPSLGVRFSTLVAFLWAVRRVAPVITRINVAFVELSRARSTFEVMEEVMQRLPQERRGGASLEPVTTVEFVKAVFAYAVRPDHLVLKDVNLTMRRGTVTAIVGSTGAGKSTVANLLLGLYQLRGGFIRINGIELSTLDLTAWRRKVGYVAQDIFLFNATIRENIALWKEASEAEVIWAAEVAQLHAFISTLPQGYQTVVGDRGLRLSGGQCQRLAIARAILRHPEVLIFDEATSALDNLTERAVYDAIGAVHREAIVMVIAHRLSTVKEADRIIVLHEGGVVESGTHEQLLAHGGIYTRLYEESQEEDERSSDPSRYAESPEASR